MEEDMAGTAVVTGGTFDVNGGQYLA